MRPYLKPILLSLFLIIFFNAAKATTWDEPWQNEVVKKADYFVLAKVTSSDSKSVDITILKQFGGKPLDVHIKLTNFYLLHLCSYSAGEEPRFEFKHADSCYFFIKKNDKNEYCIATPTTGFAAAHDGKVAATYRHSYNQAIVDQAVYENTMIAIYNHYHNLPYNVSYINAFINKYLALKPAGINIKERDLFFNQHVALECIYHLGLKNYYSKIIPFLKDTANFHAQASAAQALISYNSPASKHALMAIIADTTSNNFVKVICIWTLKAYKPKELRPELIKIEKKASTDENGFGGNFMDPRVCTHFPTVKAALDDLLAEIK